MSTLTITITGDSQTADYRTARAAFEDVVETFRNHGFRIVSGFGQGNDDRIGGYALSAETRPKPFQPEPVPEPVPERPTGKGRKKAPAPEVE